MMSGAEFLLLFALGQVAAGVAPPFAPEEIDYFEKKVRPILVERCYECHSAKAKRVEAGLYLDRREAIIAGGESGSAVTPGNPEQSRLISAVGYSNEDLQMPPDGKITDDEIA